MKSALIALVAGSGLLLLVAAAGEQKAGGAAGGKNPLVWDVVARQNEDLATLWLLDGPMHSLNLVDSGPGSVVQDNELRNRGAQLDFGACNPGCFTVGVQGGEDGRIVDLGTPGELAQRFGYAETVGGGQGFASLRFENGVLAIRNGHVAEADALFGPQASPDHAQVALEHVYVARIFGKNDPAEVLVKLHVVALQPGQSVTFRWERLAR
jgi:hypothetical protein